MRVATFNILNGRVPTDQHVDLGGFRSAIRDLDADVLALQEVDRNQHRSDHADLTAIAAEAMGAPEHRFVAALSGSPGATWIAATGEEQPDAAAYGIALLSRFPVRGWRVVRLAPVPVPVPMRFRGRLRPELVRDEPRVAVVADVATQGGTVTVVNTHLSFIDWWNGRQLRHLMADVADEQQPLVLMGDLNMGPDRATRITGLRPAASEPTFPVDDPRQQIDHVLVRGRVHATGAAALRLPVSDHRALTAELTVLPGSA
ncbi:MAG: endonuclease [Dermatophilaceae bacterium]|nr:endonuclease [Dermatophilaceae bacterium]NUO89702.1 endonuclease [Dermatophilaceae bacterium]NUR79593.1 endonuclease [Dermatophilaceae bacterium]